MNTYRFPSRPAGLLGLFTSLALAVPAMAVVDPLAPSGTIDVANKFIRTGKKVQVTWEITYPSKIGDLLQFGASGRFKTTQDLDIKIQAIGAGYTTVKSNNGHGNNIDGVDVSNPGRGRGGPNGEVDRSGPLDDEIKLNGNARQTQLELDATLWVAQGGTWTEIFQGGASSLQGDVIYYENSLPAGTTVDLAAQGKGTRGPNEMISTTSPTPNLVVLTDGDPLPAGTAAFATGQIAGFLSPYVQDGHVRLGPLQALYLFDLDSSPGSPGYNLQDLGVLVSVTPNAGTNPPVSPPEISQFNDGRSPHRENPTRRPNSGGNGNPGGNDNPGGSTTPGVSPDNTGNAPKAAGDDHHKRSSNRTGDDLNTPTPDAIGNRILIGSRYMILLVDSEALIAHGLTLEDLKVLLSPESSARQAELVERLLKLGLLIEDKTHREHHD